MDGARTVENFFRGSQMPMHNVKCLPGALCALLRRISECYMRGKAVKRGSKFISLCEPSEQRDGSPSRTLSGNFHPASALYK